jgi:TDG/mug DNA glycosylase family protein
MDQPWKPTRQQLADAAGKSLPDVIAPGLDVLFVGINPGLYSAAIQRHFGRPGNRFWPALFASGFTPRLLSPFEEQELLPLRLGVTNIAHRATARADELTDEELLAGGKELRRKARRYRPRFLAFLGVTAYRTAFQIRQATLGRQEQRIAESVAWVLPSPSGLNAHYQLDDLARLFGELRVAARANP